MQKDKLTSHVPRHRTDDATYNYIRERAAKERRKIKEMFQVYMAEKVRQEPDFKTYSS